MRQFLIAAGALLLLAGLLWPWLGKLGLGRLPGDIRIETASGGFYFPITTCLLVSAVLSLVVWLLRRWFFHGLAALETDLRPQAPRRVRARRHQGLQREPGAAARGRGRLLRAALDRAAPHPPGHRALQPHGRGGAARDALAGARVRGAGEG